MNNEQGEGPGIKKEPAIGDNDSISADETEALGGPVNSTTTAQKKAEKFWHIKSSSISTDDSLLGCLVVLTRLEHHPFSPESLSAGLPLVDNKLTPELFVRAAERAEMSAQIVKRSLKEISPLVLPAVLLLRNRQACILVAHKKGGIVQIIQPEAGGGLRELKMEKLETQYSGYAIFTRPSYQFEARTKISGFKKPENWFFDVMFKILPFYLEIMVASLLVNLFALASPLFVMNVYDRVVPNNAMETLMVLAIGIGTVYCFDFLMKMLRSYFIDVAGKKADILLSATIFEHMIGIKMEARPESVGSFANNISQFDSFRDFMTSATMSTVIDLPFVVVFILVIYAIGGPLAYVPLFAIPVVIISGLIIQAPLNKIVKESYRYTSQKQAMLIESLIGIESIKVIAAEGALQKKWEHLGGISSNHTIKSRILSTLATNISALSTQISGVILIIVGVRLISAGEITMGALIACNMLNGRALQPLGQVASLITRYHQAITSFKSVDGMMKMPTERPPGKTLLHRPEIMGDIEFRDVSFRYPAQDELALENVSFRISPGEKVGFIGRVGSGKTTIEKLLLGLYAPLEGSILLDGTETQQLDPVIIRKSIGYVPQDIILFYGSVKDNIVMGAPYSDDSAILRAASIAGVTDFVAQHPKGFDLAVGERGERLSGGQRQCVAIARSLLLDPTMLVFDEPTNMMDHSTEAILKLKLQQIIQDKTLILVTHKSSLLNLVDRIIMLDRGRIIADGPKEAVIKALAEGKIKSPGAKKQ